MRYLVAAFTPQHRQSHTPLASPHFATAVYLPIPLLQPVALYPHDRRRHDPAGRAGFLRRARLGRRDRDAADSHRLRGRACPGTCRPPSCPRLSMTPSASATGSTAGSGMTARPGPPRPQSRCGSMTRHGIDCPETMTRHPHTPAMTTNYVTSKSNSPNIVSAI